MTPRKRPELGSLREVGKHLKPLWYRAIRKREIQKAKNEWNRQYRKRKAQ
jgi:hypothetical protein